MIPFTKGGTGEIWFVHTGSIVPALKTYWYESLEKSKHKNNGHEDRWRRQRSQE